MMYFKSCGFYQELSLGIQKKGLATMIRELDILKVFCQ